MSNQVISLSQSVHFSEDDNLKRPIQCLATRLCFSFPANKKVNNGSCTPGLDLTCNQSGEARHRRHRLIVGERCFQFSFPRVPELVHSRAAVYLADLQDVTEMELHKCVTERAGTGTGRHRLPTVQFLSFQKFPRRL